MQSFELLKTHPPTTPYPTPITTNSSCLLFSQSSNPIAHVTAFKGLMVREISLSHRDWLTARDGSFHCLSPVDLSPAPFSASAALWQCHQRCDIFATMYAGYSFEEMSVCRHACITPFSLFWEVTSKAHDGRRS